MSPHERVIARTHFYTAVDSVPAPCYWSGSHACPRRRYWLIGRADGLEGRAINNLRNHATQNSYVLLAPEPLFPPYHATAILLQSITLCIIINRPPITPLPSIPPPQFRHGSVRLPTAATPTLLQEPGQHLVCTSLITIFCLGCCLKTLLLPASCYPQPLPYWQVW